MPQPLYLDKMEERVEESYNERQRLFKLIEERNMTPASKLRKQVYDYLKAKGYMVINLIECKPSGIPDLLLETGSDHIYIELKAEGDRLRTNQKIIQEKLRLLNCKVYNIRTIEELKEIL